MKLDHLGPSDPLKTNPAMKTFLLIVALIISFATVASAAVGGGSGAPRTLVWDDPNPAGVVLYFNVYASSGVAPVAFWQWLASPVDPDFQFSVTAPQQFFAVSAVTAQGEFPPIGQSQSLVTSSPTNQ